VLAAQGLEKFAAKLEDEGYDDCETLKGMDKGELKEVADDVGMSEEEATKFIGLFAK